MHVGAAAVCFGPRARPGLTSNEYARQQLFSPAERQVRLCGQQRLWALHLHQTPPRCIRQGHTLGACEPRLQALQVLFARVQRQAGKQRRLRRRRCVSLAVLCNNMWV